jgi:hypothetical protein
MKPFAFGALGAAAAIAMFIWGVTVGIRVEQSDVSPSLNQPHESAQMQCIHWVDKWRSAPDFPNQTPGAPVFGMYTALCGKPDAK